MYAFFFEEGLSLLFYKFLFITNYLKIGIPNSINENIIIAIKKIKQVKPSITIKNKELFSKYWIIFFNLGNFVSISYLLNK